MQREKEDDLTRTMVRGLLTLLLTTLATWLANKLTETILGPAEEADYLGDVDDLDGIAAGAEAN